jgi:hypothetical protein
MEQGQNIGSTETLIPSLLTLIPFGRLPNGAGRVARATRPGVAAAFCLNL